MDIESTIRDEARSLSEESVHQIYQLPYTPFKGLETYLSKLSKALNLQEGLRYSGELVERLWEEEREKELQREIEKHSKELRRINEIVKHIVFDDYELEYEREIYRDGEYAGVERMKIKWSDVIKDGYPNSNLIIDLSEEFTNIFWVEYWEGDEERTRRRLSREFGGGVVFGDFRKARGNVHAHDKIWRVLIWIKPRETQLHT